MLISFVFAGANLALFWDFGVFYKNKVVFLLAKLLILMERNRQIYKVTLVGGLVNVVLLVFKFVAGILGHSAAMVADAVHSFSDFVTDIVVLVFVHISGKPQDRSHEYGHGKYETLAMTIIGMALLLWHRQDCGLGAWRGAAGTRHLGTLGGTVVCGAKGGYLPLFHA